MHAIDNLPEPKRILVEQIVARLAQTDGVAAVVLGGSYANGTQHAGSDIDLGLYYEEASPFSIRDIQAVADEISIGEPAAVTEFYGWGAWVNGGGWIHTAEGKVDIIYRNLQQVERTIAEAQAGIAYHDYEQQPTNGFYSVIYLAETQICVPLFDPRAKIAGLKQQVELYPSKLKQAILANSLWSTEFTLIHARGFAAQGDVYNTAGCLTRGSANLTQALFALNEKYFLRDKKVMQTIASFPLLPPNYVERTLEILACPGCTAEQLIHSVLELEAIWRSVTTLPGVHYTPQFRL